MNIPEKDNNCPTKWFAIKTRQDFRAEEVLKPFCEEVFFPKEKIRLRTGRTRNRALIPHVLFIKLSHDDAIELEQKSRKLVDVPIPFWIYRYPFDPEIREIPQSTINLLKMLTADDTTQCEIFNKTDFKEKERVRIIGGPYQGYEGFVQRVKKNKHVVVRIEGICLVLLPFIHPDLLQKLD